MSQRTVLVTSCSQHSLMASSQAGSSIHRAGTSIEIHRPPNWPDNAENQAKIESGYHKSYIVPMTITFMMLAVPLFVVGLVCIRRGVAASPYTSALILKNPQTVNFVTTQLGTLFGAITAFMFSTALVLFAQKWIANRTRVNMHHIAFFSDLRHQRFPGSFTNWSNVVKRWYLVIIVAVYVVTFNFVPSGISALLVPIPLNQTVPLIGKELDFASSVPDCVSWLRESRIQGFCDWSVSSLTFRSAT